jgi:hypothetical protein
MSTLETNLIQPSTGTALTVGASGDTITVPSGATFNVAGTLQSGGSAITQGIKEADQWRVTATTSVSGSSDIVTSNWERADNDFGLIGTGMSQSSGVFTFPQTGIYKIDWKVMAVSSSGSADYTGGDIQYSTDNFSSSNNIAAAYNSMDGTSAYIGADMTFIFDVTNTSTHKVRFRFITDGSANFEGNTNRNWQVATFIRLGDT